MDGIIAVGMFSLTSFRSQPHIEQALHADHIPPGVFQVGTE